MDALDKLKGAWKSQDYSKHRVSSTDIVKMLHAKSSSYVKWIFYISIFEFVFIILLNLLVDNNKNMAIFNDMGMENMILTITVISYLIMIVFIVLFYKNYQKINVNTNAKTLMKDILNTRKTVKTYIYFNISFMAITSFLMFYTVFSNEENTGVYRITSDIQEDFSTNALIIAISVSMLLFIGLLLLIYRLIYGILLRRLKKNYKELEQLDK